METLKIGNTEYNVEWLKSVTLQEALKSSLPNIEEAWRLVNKKPKKSK